MFTKTLIAAAVTATLTLSAFNAQADQGISSSADSYIKGIAPGVSFTSIFTTGDAIGGYQMGGIPDGLGAYDNGNGTFTVLMNHELGGTSGVTRAHGAKGAYVSEWVINKSDFKVVSGGDLIRNVYGWDSNTQQSLANSAATSFNRFCSADLAPITSLYNASTGLGTQSRIFMKGEEGGANGFAVATVATGADKGNAYVLGKMNPATNGSGINAVGGWENLLANPIAQNKTIVIGNNDGGTGVMNNALALYVGNKQATGSEIDKAGLTNGVTKFIQIAGNATEINSNTDRTTGIADGTRFGLSDTASTKFSRPEDGAWSDDGKTYYFATTDQLDKTDVAGGTQKGGTRVWSMSFDDISNPDAGGTINVVFDSTKVAGGLGNNKPNMFDNMTVTKDGKIILQEDVGNAEHVGKVWEYDIATKSIRVLGEFDRTLFGDLKADGSFVAGLYTKDEESSGVIDVTDILGKNDGAKYYLLTSQIHASAASLGLTNPTALVEGGQLNMMRVAAVPEPETYAMLLAGLGMLGTIARRRKAK